MLIVALSLCLDELAHVISYMQQPSASSSTDEGIVINFDALLYNGLLILVFLGEHSVDVPDALMKELVDLRIAFAKLIRNYEKQLYNSPEAQVEFVKFLPRLFHRLVEDHSYQSQFNTLVEEVSLFNIFYLKQLCSIFPEDV